MTDIVLSEDTFDYKAWAIDLCSLLDEIALNRDDPDKVDALLVHRFQIARDHGMTVTFVRSQDVGHG